MVYATMVTVWENMTHSIPMFNPRDIHITKVMSSASYIMGQFSISILTLFDKQPQKVGRCLYWLSEFEGLVLYLT